MYYQNYEDYMRSVLGYPVETTYDNYIIQSRDYNVSYQNNNELENMYPEIYKKINPMVCEVCERSKTPITKEVLENMVEEVYQRIEINNEIWLKINVDENITQKEIQNRTTNTNANSKANSVRNVSELEGARQVNQIENRQRRPNNPLLRDLIRILILNKILGGFFPNRPPHPRPPRPPFPGPGRPPFPGGPGGMPPRPQPRDYEDYFKF